MVDTRGKYGKEYGKGYTGEWFENFKKGLTAKGPKMPFFGGSSAKAESKPSGMGVKSGKMQDRSSGYGPGSKKMKMQYASQPAAPKETGMAMSKPTRKPNASTPSITKPSKSDYNSRKELGDFYLNATSGMFSDKKKKR